MRSISILTVWGFLLLLLPHASSGQQELMAGQMGAAQDLMLLEPEQTISMDLQDASLKDVLKIFSMQSGMNFIASQTVENRKITLYLDKVPLREAMNKLFQANNLTYEYDESSNIFIINYWGEPEVELITRVYRLKHRSVSSSNMLEEKDALFSSRGFIESGAVENDGRSLEEKQENDIAASIRQVLSKHGKLGEDKQSNCLIVTDIPSRFAAIEQIIRELDKPEPQVMLEVEMLDVSKDVVDSLGFDFSSSPVSSHPISWALGRGPHDEFAFGNLAQRGQSLATTASQGYLMINTEYAALLDFLSTRTDTRFLARPRILTLNHETAEIGITKDEVVSKQTKIETLESGREVETTEYERATSLKLTPEGIGIFLRVTPQVNIETNEITMVVNPKTSSTVLSSDVTTGTERVKDPEIRSTKSIIKVQDGQTVVLGGLIHHDSQVVNEKLPILGDIPLIGMLFRHKETPKDLERELLVFITPRIIRHPNAAAPRTVALAPSRAGRPASGKKDEVESYLNIFDRKK